MKNKFKQKPGSKEFKRKGIVSHINKDKKKKNLF